MFSPENPTSSNTVKAQRACPEKVWAWPVFCIPLGAGVRNREMCGCSCFCICHRGNKPGAGSLRPFSTSFCLESQRPCPGLQNKAQEVLLGMSFTLTCSQAKGRRIREAPGSFPRSHPGLHLDNVELVRLQPGPGVYTDVDQSGIILGGSCPYRGKLTIGATLPGAEGTVCEAARFAAPT